MCLRHFSVSPQTHYVISESQGDVDMKKNGSLTEEVSTNSEQLEQTDTNPPQTAQYIIATNMNGSNEVHISKP